MTNTEKLAYEAKLAEERKLLAQEYELMEDGEISLSNLSDDEVKAYKIFSLETEMVDDFENVQIK
ncbi:hypothetical protein KDE13_09270 [Campylobacter sp. faydin G-140]|uniref:hypothetical protein n=1 Tax=Campylobacter anatolicus TaxID=2829105 RepID=UPI001B967E75|nr:hypothetical protein [Campylobacter anatolicus]MBR8466523.1 hypothetical protein [Campylobacter anatolicus]